MIVNFGTYYTKHGMREMFCREMISSGIVEKCRENALWYGLYLPIDGSDRVVCYQGWQDEEAIRKHNTAGYAGQLKALKKYYLTATVNETQKTEELTIFDMSEIEKKKNKKIASWVVYELLPDASREEMCRKINDSGVYALCQKDAERFEFLLPADGTNEVELIERWCNAEQLLKHCMADHVTGPLQELKKPYVKSNGCKGVYYTFLENMDIE